MIHEASAGARNLRANQPAAPAPAAKPRRAVDDPVVLARAARIIRGALARNGLTLADLRAPEDRDRPGHPAEALAPGCGGGSDDGTRRPEAEGVGAPDAGTRLGPAPTSQVGPSHTPEGVAV